MRGKLTLKNNEIMLLLLSMITRYLLSIGEKYPFYSARGALGVSMDIDVHGGAWFFTSFDKILSLFWGH